jgi:hypothetical protein
MSNPTHTVRFVETTPYEIRLSAASDGEAIATARHLIETLSPVARAQTFRALETTYENFEAEPVLKSFRITVEAKAIYEAEIQARDKDDAEEKAEDKWNVCGFEDFAFQDCMEVHFDAEEVQS